MHFGHTFHLHPPSTQHSSQASHSHFLAHFLQIFSPHEEHSSEHFLQNLLVQLQVVIHLVQVICEHMLHFLPHSVHTKTPHTLQLPQGEPNEPHLSHIQWFLTHIFSKVGFSSFQSFYHMSLSSHRSSRPHLQSGHNVYLPAQEVQRSTPHSSHLYPQLIWKLHKAHLFTPPIK